MSYCLRGVINLYCCYLVDPNYESRLKIENSLKIYVPRDEKFEHLKMSDFLAYALKSIVQVLKPELESIFDSTPNEFDSFDDVHKLYYGGIKVPQSILKGVRDNIHGEMFKEILRTDGENFLKFPLPQVIAGNVNMCMSNSTCYLAN